VFQPLEFFCSTLKVASLSPGITEIIFALKKEKCLVGKSSACNYIKGSESIPVVGNMGSPNLEKLMLVKPDVVIASALKDKSSARVIENLGIKVYVLSFDTIDGYYKTVRTLGKILDADNEAGAEINRVKNGLAVYEKKIQQIPFEKRPTVFIEIWDSPLMTAGRKSFLNDLVYYAGGRNIASGINRNYFQVTKEWVIACNPQVIIAPFMSDQTKLQLSKSAVWKSVSAVKNGKVYNHFDLNQIYTLGPHILEAIESLRKCVMYDL
jgi:iron complex transport system substrate-binding protein